MSKNAGRKLTGLLVVVFVAMFVTLGCENPLNSGTQEDDTTAPSSISDMSYTTGDGQISFSWTDPSASDLDYIKVTWTPEDGENQPKQIDPGAESATVTGLSNGTKYTFSVVVVDTSGNESDPITFEATPEVPDTSAPAEVTELAVSSGDTEVNLYWKDPLDSDFDHVEITWDSTDGESQPKTVSGGNESATITGLSNGTTYTFTVKTVDTNENTSNGTSIQGTPTASDSIAPAEVNNLTPTAGVGEMTLTWNDPADGDFDHVTISWTPEDGESQPKTIMAGTESITITGLTNRTNYTFTVKTVDTSGNTSSGNTVSATPPLIAFGSNRDADGDAEIFVMNADGSNQRQLTSNTQYDTQITWTPDGSKIVFASMRSDGDGVEDYDIYTMNPDGTNQTNLNSNSVDDMFPVLSPSGDRIAFFSSTEDDSDIEIYVMNTDGSGTPSVITTNAVGEGRPSWSPDGTQITYVARSDDGVNHEAGTHQIYVVNVDGTNPTPITDQSYTDGHPDWSPTNSNIVFVSDRNADSYQEIWVVDAGGADSPTKIAESSTGSFVAPVWSPDGSMIAFKNHGTGTDSTYNLSVVDSDGQNYRELISSNSLQTYHSPVWNPWSSDSTQLVFHSNADGDFDVYTITNSEGSDPTQLTTSSYWNGIPAWQY